MPYVLHGSSIKKDQNKLHINLTSNTKKFQKGLLVFNGTFSTKKEDISCHGRFK